MKSVVKKFRNLLDKEYEIRLPKRGLKKQEQQPKQTVQRPGYVNPFKHQQEIQQRLPSQQSQSPQLPKSPIPSKLVAHEKPQPKPIQQVTPAPQALKPPKKPSFFDKKIEITLKKPSFLTKKPPQPKPEVAQPIIVKTEPQLPEIQKTVLAIPEVKAPEIRLSEAKTPEAIPDAAPKPVVPHTPVKKREIKMPRVTFKKPNITLPKFPKLKTEFKPKKQHGIAFAIVAIGILVFGVSYFGIRLPFQAEKPQAQETAQTIVEAPPAVKLAEAIGKKAKLPTDEDPVSATVSDKEKLKDQEFFKKAQNGDKILMYKVNKKAYLYRPSTDEVIAIAPLNFQDVAGTATEAAEVIEEAPDPNAPKTSVMPEPPHGKVLVPARY